MSKENFVKELKSSVGICYNLECNSCSFEEISDPDRYDSKEDFLKGLYNEGWRYAESENFSIDCAAVCPSCMKNEDEEEDWKEKV